MDKAKDYITKYLTEVKEICDSIDKKEIALLVEGIQSLKERKGRLFILGVGVRCWIARRGHGHVGL